MPAAAPEHAPRPRLAPWLLAGAVVVAVAALLAAAAWFFLPTLRAEWVCRNWPWASTATRAALAQEKAIPLTGYRVLEEWAIQDRTGGRCNDLAPYLASPNGAMRMIVAHALGGLTRLPHSPAVDRALLAFLADPNWNLRVAGVEALTDPASIPALEAHGVDPVQDVADAIALTLQRLRGPRPAPL